MKRLKQQISELNFSKNFAQKTINWARWQLFQDLKASKARPSMVLFYYNELHLCGGQKN